MPQPEQDSVAAEDRTAKIRVLIVDDHAVVRAGITALLGIEADMEVCGEAGDTIEAMRLLEACEPDVVILDLALDGCSGLDLLKDLRPRGIAAKVLVVSAQDEALFAERCVRAGAFGFLSKREAVDRIVDSIRRVQKGEYCLSDQVTAQIMGHLASSHRKKQTNPMQSLSDRELQVYEAIGAGLSAKEIATRLFLSPKTIDTYRAKLKAKLGLDSSQQLARHAMQWVLEQIRP